MEIHNNTDLMQFEYKEGDAVAFLKYNFYKKKNIALLHTEVPDALKGKGIGTALAQYAFDYALENNKMVMVYCPFVSRFVKKNPELKKQLNPEYYR